MERYAICVELLQNEAPFTAVAAASSVTDEADEATVVVTAAGVGCGVGVFCTVTPSVGTFVG